MECYICLLERAIRIANILTKDREKVLRVAKEVSRMLMEEFSFDAVPAHLGTIREKMVSEILGIKDPYHQIKRDSNTLAMTIARDVFSKIDLSDLSYETFRRIMILSAAANAMEWFIRGHEFSLDRFESTLLSAEHDIVIDNTRELYDIIKGSKTLLYVLDNAGEAVIDRYVVSYLRNLVEEIYVGARSAPILNDITVDEAREIGFGDVCDDIIPVGDFVGVVLEKTTKEFRDIFERADIIILKGMGAFESITEYNIEKPVFILLKAKCVTVARSLGVPQGRLVIKRIF